MRIENLSTRQNGEFSRVSATVIWEDCERPAQEVYYETDAAFADALTPNPHAFLVGCLLPALRHGEERLAIDEPICPELRNGLLTAMGWICAWYGPPRKAVRIEARPGVRRPLTHTAGRAGSFLSGGIDSLSILRANRLDYPLDHRRAFRDCLIVHGFDIGHAAGVESELWVFQRAVAAMGPVAEDAGITLIPVHTNVRHLESDVSFWMYEFHGAALSSVAHALSNRLSRVSIASCFAIADQQPWGAHPVLDPNYSSTDMQIVHDGLRLTRLEKAQIVADWDVALQNLRVCWRHPPDVLNCGECDKCIYTMLELLVAGKLAETQAFPVNDVSAELLSSVTIVDQFRHAFYREMIDPLVAIGRKDLAEVIQEKSAEFQKVLAWKEEEDWKGAVKRFDRKFLGAGLYRSWKTVRPRLLQLSR